MDFTFSNQLVQACLAMGGAYNHHLRLEKLGATPKELFYAQATLLHTQINFYQLEMQAASATRDASKASQVASLLSQAQSDLAFLETSLQKGNK